MTDQEFHHAQLQWDEEGQPISAEFGDVYFSRANGLEETRHVFLQHNQLQERWQQLKSGEHFTIAETGFGSGLNFLAAWALWLATAPADAQLHFVSVEKFPLTQQDLSRALSLWPEITQLSHQLIEKYPVFIGTGFHRLNFMDGRVKLTLIIDEATEGFRKLLMTEDPEFANKSAMVDAWFLDGFAPAKNPQMWSDELFSCIDRLSRSNATAATFSAAAIVKNGLAQAGFSVQKVAGFGRKREMVKAIKVSSPAFDEKHLIAKPRSYSPYSVPWALSSNHILYTHKSAIVIGGGLAGCSSARALAERGWEITLVERHAQLAQEGSGNPQGVLYAKLSHKTEAQAEFNLAALQYALSFYQPLWPKIGAQCGVLQLAHCESEQQLHNQLREKFSTAENLVSFVDNHRASEIAGVELQHSGLYFPQAGWINPPSLCKYLIDHPNIELISDTLVSALQQQTSGWKIHTGSQELAAPVVVVANARDAKLFAQTQVLPIKHIRGQISFLPRTPLSEKLRTVVCSEGYIGPAINDVHCTGATFNLKDDSLSLRATDHQTNLDNLRDLLPELMSPWENLDSAHIEGRVGFRCALPDYLPAIGPIPNEGVMLEDFAPLRKNARANINKTGTWLPGLYINIGHGSRGLAYTPLCAEILAAHINQEPMPINRELVNALHPARFLIRDIIKNKR